ncbi:MAG: ATP-binding protein [Bacillota bacterium]|nr:ATP-binding protein [Bacillota bacterium]
MSSLPIRLRLTLWYTLILALALLCFGLFLYFTTARALHTQVDTSLQLVASQAVANLQDEDGRPALQNSDEPGPLPALLAARGYVIRLLADTGEVLDGTGEYRRLPVVVPAPGLATCMAAGEPWRLYTTALTYLPDHEGPSEGSASAGTGAGVRTYLQVAQSLAGVREAEGQMRLLLAFAIPVAVILAAAGGAFLADRALRPIDRITREARRVGAEDLGRRLNLKLPDDEVGRLARTFDEMLARLDKAFRRERQFTSDAAHELRTPLTVLKGAIGVALHRPRTAAQYREVLRNLEAEVDRLIALAEDLLTLARSESTAPGDQGSTADLAQVAALAVERLRSFATARGVFLELDMPVPLPVAGDPDRLGRAIYNLVHNGVKYTTAGGHVRVSGQILARPQGTNTPLVAPSTAHATAEVRVADDGPGISPEDLPHVFDRFFRADRARTRTGSEEPASGAGAGLGLTIARSIAGAHGGDIAATSTPGGGSTFVLRLPLAPHP